MKIHYQKVTALLSIFLLIGNIVFAQDIKRSRPAEWEGLVDGARFIDRFLPMPAIGQLSSKNWGAKGVQPRYVDNGLEDNTWSYWGGNIVKGEDGKFHAFICRWREDAEKGHMRWPWSHVIHAVCDNTLGPFKVVDSIGKGHNPEIQQLSNGKYFLYVNGGYYLSSSVNGPWEYYKFEYDQRGRAIFDHNTNFTFAQREDGSYLMVGRGGEIAFSKDGLPPYYQVNEKTVYPPYDGRYEDPVVWRTNIQYHMIVNDWLGRIAYYLRSKDGINWKLDAGEAYKPGIAYYADGTVEDWYKFERIKMFQDKYGRAIQANFAVCDTTKHDDLGSDNHSSKNIGIPLIYGRLITILDKDKIDANTQAIYVLIEAENNFNPHKDIDLKSLRFGTSEEVNFGRGSKVIKTQKLGKDLMITFAGKGNGITKDNFAAKMLGKDKKGQLLFGYARLPWVNYNQQALSAKYPELSLNGKKLKVEVEVLNFGQVVSKPSKIKVEYLKNNKWMPIVKGTVPSLKSFDKNVVTLFHNKFAERGETVKVKVTILQDNQQPVTLEGGIIIR